MSWLHLCFFAEKILLQVVLSPHTSKSPVLQSPPVCVMVVTVVVVTPRPGWVSTGSSIMSLRGDQLPSPRSTVSSMLCSDDRSSSYCMARLGCHKQACFQGSNCRSCVQDYCPVRNVLARLPSMQVMALDRRWTLTFWWLFGRGCIRNSSGWQRWQGRGQGWVSIVTGCVASDSCLTKKLNQPTALDW